MLGDEEHVVVFGVNLLYLSLLITIVPVEGRKIGTQAKMYKEIKLSTHRTVSHITNIQRDIRVFSLILSYA